MKFKTPGELPVMIGLTSGDTLTISPEGTDVPTRFRREAIARGCVPVGVGADEEVAEVKEKGKQELIVEAINKLLDGDDEAAFDKSGKPKVTAIETVAGFGITAEERNAAWATVEASLGAEKPE